MSPQSSTSRGTNQGPGGMRRAMVHRASGRSFFPQRGRGVGVEGGGGIRVGWEWRTPGEDMIEPIELNMSKNA